MLTTSVWNIFLFHLLYSQRRQGRNLLPVPFRFLHNGAQCFVWGRFCFALPCSALIMPRKENIFPRGPRVPSPEGNRLAGKKAWFSEWLDFKTLLPFYPLPLCFVMFREARFNRKNNHPKDKQSFQPVLNSLPVRFQDSPNPSTSRGCGSGNGCHALAPCETERNRWEFSPNCKRCARESHLNMATIPRRGAFICPVNKSDSCLMFSHNLWTRKVAARSQTSAWRNGIT